MLSATETPAANVAPAQILGPMLVSLSVGHPHGMAPCLLALLAHAKAEQERLAAAIRRQLPLLIECPAGPASEKAVQIAQRIGTLGYDGMIAAFEAPAPADSAWENWASGACQGVAQTLGPQMTLIAVGGIDRVRRALDLRDAGARLVQLYRGFETFGPPLVRACARGWAICARTSPAPA